VAGKKMLFSKRIQFPCGRLFATNGNQDSISLKIVLSFYVVGTFTQNFILTAFENVGGTHF